MNNVIIDKSGNFKLLPVLGVIFITLKLTGHITWSWPLVLLPFWGPIALLFAIVLIVAILNAFLK